MQTYAKDANFLRDKSQLNKILISRRKRKWSRRKRAKWRCSRKKYGQIVNLEEGKKVPGANNDIAGLKQPIFWYYILCDSCLAPSNSPLHTMGTKINILQASYNIIKIHLVVYQKIQSLIYLTAFGGTRCIQFVHMFWAKVIGNANAYWPTKLQRACVSAWRTVSVYLCRRFLHSFIVPIGFFSLFSPLLIWAASFSQLDEYTIFETCVFFRFHSSRTLIFPSWSKERLLAT